MFPGETIGSGAQKTCKTCGVTVLLNVYRSAAGWYIGSFCRCGPYSRESVYYKSEGEARDRFQDDSWERRQP